MKFGTISDDFFDLISFETELMQNKGQKRPYLVNVKLKYKGKKQNFAIPFRSNIANYIPKEQYYSLPPRHSTKQNKIHGLHYIKMFPVTKQYLQKYNTTNDPYFQMIEEIVNKNKKEIIDAAQDYLEKYEGGYRTDYAVNIDKVYYTLANNKAMEEVVATNETS